jgi:hypothetical protein
MPYSQVRVCSTYRPIVPSLRLSNFDTSTNPFFILSIVPYIIHISFSAFSRYSDNTLIIVHRLPDVLPHRDGHHTCDNLFRRAQVRPEEPPGLRLHLLTRWLRERDGH